MKIKMIYLAAGNSRRFGSNKLYHEIEGRPMFQYGLEALEKVLRRREETTLTVVTQYSEIWKYVLEKQRVWGGRISAVASPEAEKGISYSIRAGLSGDCADYYLFCVADQPWVSDETILRLIDTTTQGGYIGGFAQWNGVSGNPAIFSDRLFPELLALTGDTGGKKILRGRENVCTVQVENPIEIEDIDEISMLPFDTKK